MFRKKLVKTSLIILLGFVLLFLFRLLYGYTSKHTDRDEEYFSDFLMASTRQEKTMQARNINTKRWSMLRKCPKYPMQRSLKNSA